MGDFEWPPMYSFPPSFTVQPNLDTRKRQLDGWCELVMAYYRHKKLYTVDIKELEASPLFSNTKIGRKLSSEGIKLVLDELTSRGNIEWEGKDRTRGLLVWRTAAQWASQIYKWVENNGLTDTVCTVYELLNGDATAGTEIHGMDPTMLRKALRHLETERKAQLFTGSSPDDDGVKFF